jgi:hypothetical protein
MQSFPVIHAAQRPEAAPFGGNCDQFASEIATTGRPVYSKKNWTSQQAGSCEGAAPQGQTN